MTPQASAERIPLPDDYGFGVGFRIHINPDLALGPEPTNRFYFQEALERTGLPIHLNERPAPGKWYGSTMWFYKNGERPTDGLVSINSPNYPQPFLSGEEGLRQMHQLENEALIPFNNVFSNSQQRQLSLSIPLTRGNTFSEAKEIISSYARNREHFPFRQSKMIKYAPFGSILEGSGLNMRGIKRRNPTIFF